MTSPILHIATIPVDGVKLTKEWEEVKLDDDRKFDFMYGGVNDNTAVRDIGNSSRPPSNDGRCHLAVPPIGPQWPGSHGTGSPLHRVGGH
jgi:hypothetical protein